MEKAMNIKLSESLLRNLESEFAHLKLTGLSPSKPVVPFGLK